MALRRQGTNILFRNSSPSLESNTGVFLGRGVFLCFKGKKILMTGDVAAGKQLEVLNCGRYECSEVTPGKHKTGNLESTKNNLPLIISSLAALFHKKKKKRKEPPKMSSGTQATFFRSKTSELNKRPLLFLEQCLQLTCLRLQTGILQRKEERVW